MSNKFYNEIQEAYINNASTEQLKDLLGRGRAKKGMFEGDLDNGELEIGQVSAMIKEIMPVAEIMSEIIEEFKYSDAMKNSDIIWNDDTLDNFLKNPREYIEGTRMTFAGIKKDSDREALIAYLKENQIT